MPQFSTSPVLHATPNAGHAPITVERGEGVSPGAAALMAGVGGAAIGAGVVFAAKLGNKEEHHEDEKA